MFEELHNIPLFAELPDDQLRWVYKRSHEITLQKGAILFAEGTPAQDFFVILEGVVQITKRVNGQETVLIEHHAGVFTGEIPLLTGTPYVATARALQPSRILVVCTEAFEHLLASCSIIAKAVLPTLAGRVRSMELEVMQQEKLAALGKMSAGLAHELNNPSAATQSAAAQMRGTFTGLQELTLQLCTHDIDIQYMVDVQREAIQRALSSPSLDPLAQSDLEDALTAWMDDHGVDDGWQLAPTFVEAGLDTAWFDALAERVSANALGLVLTWLETALRMSGLCNTVEQSASRISALVKSIKAYTYMDQAPVQEVDIHEGLENTLTILSFKLKNITVTREYDREMPNICAHGGELNQVWTNLLDNAIAALNGRGAIRVRTWREYDRAVVEIGDNGPGIPPEVQSHIFEPFYTTKGVGDGTGLGLDTVYRIVVVRHKGDIHVDSVPGDTRFQVRLPFDSPETQETVKDGATREP